MPPLTRFSTLAVVLFTFLPCLSANTNFKQCLADLNGSAHGLQGGVGLGGDPTNHSVAVVVTYQECIQHCGHGQEPFVWSDFSKQFSLWLLPWLALVSQLPFGAEDRLDNLISVILTVGSPTLAGYSLAITVVNSRWIHRKFHDIKFPNRRNAARVLDTLQQVPLQVMVNDGLLASLVVLPENDEWWDDLVERLDYNYKWSVATGTSVAWVAMAYLFTLIDSFANVEVDLNSSGQSVGSLWLWLLPMVIGWLLIPVCGRKKLVSALSKANDIAYVAPVVDGNLLVNGNPPIDGSPRVDGAIPADIPLLARCISDDRAISILRNRGAVFRDEHKISPIFNYARLWRWVDVVEEIIAAYEQAAQMAGRRTAVRPNTPWIEDRCAEIHPNNRVGTLTQVQDYCGYSSLDVEYHKPMWQKGVLSRVFVASVFALALQWGTTASATLVVYFTPTVGLGCRSGSYILYGILSTLVWVMLVMSSILNHYCSIHTPNIPRSRHQTKISSVSVAAGFSVFLRRLSVLIAFINSVWIILICMFQFSNVFNTCYCNSSVIGLGSHAGYHTITPGDGAINRMRGVWVGCVFLGGGCIIGYTFFVSLMTGNSG